MDLINDVVECIECGEKFIAEPTKDKPLNVPAHTQKPSGTSTCWCPGSGNNGRLSAEQKIYHVYCPVCEKCYKVTRDIERIGQPLPQHEDERHIGLKQYGGEAHEERTNLPVCKGSGKEGIPFVSYRADLERREASVSNGRLECSAKYPSSRFPFLRSAIERGKDISDIFREAEENERRFRKSG